MLEIILVRHGETDWNVGEVFRGRIDVELNETGVRQAALLGEYLKEVKLDAVYSSPLKRALKTADAMASSHTLQVNIAWGLIDFDFGEWQGLSHEDVKNRYKELYATWASHPEQVRMPDGENLDGVRKRAVAVVDNVIERYNTGRVVLVSHRVVNKVLICALLELDNSHFWNVKLDTCGITTFNYEGSEFILTGHNDISYLKPVRKAPFGDF
ncbi:histidine phosphatase family protein [Chloroflexota bacterium]